MISHKHAQITGYRFSEVDPDDLIDGLIFIRLPDLSVYVCKDKVFQPVSAKGTQLVTTKSKDGHGLVVGDWVGANYEKTSANPIGVVTFVDGRFFEVQLAGPWEHTGLPAGSIGSPLYLQADGSVGLAETNSYVGDRTETGMVIQSRGGGGGSTAGLSALEARIAANETGISTNLSNIGNQQTTLGNHAQRLALIETFFEEDTNKGWIIKGDKFVDSMVASELFSTDTSGGGTSAGGRRTEINFTQEVASGTNIEMQTGVYASYSVTGDDPSIPDGNALVTSPFIRLTLGPLEVDKETLTFVDTTTIQYDVSIVAGTKIVVYS